MALILDENISVKDVEEVVYFVSHIVLNPGNSEKLGRCEVLDEKRAREKFPGVLDVIIARLNPEDPDYARALEIKAKIENPKEAFDFYTFSNFISKHTGAEFGMGAEAIKRLLSEVNLDEEFQKIQKALKDTQGEKNQRRVKLLKRLEVSLHLI